MSILEKELTLFNRGGNPDPGYPGFVSKRILIMFSDPGYPGYVCKETLKI